MFVVKVHRSVGEGRQSEMSHRRIKVLEGLAASIRKNAPKIEQKIAANSSSGRRPDDAVVLTASKYRSALERLAQE